MDIPTDVPANISIQPAALHKLTQWLSPAFPVGAYSYSHGLEWAVQSGDVVDAQSAKDWIFGVLEFGTGWNDGVFLAQSHGAKNQAALLKISELAAAFCSGKERYLETMEMGAALAKGINQSQGGDVVPAPYPVVLGVASRANNVSLAPTLSLYLQSFGANLVFAAQRLVPLGQVSGQKIVAQMAPLIERLVPKILNASLDDLGGCALGSDLASMAHETQKTRLFRT